MRRLSLVRYREIQRENERRHLGQHPRCPECRALVERLRQYAKPGLTNREYEPPQGDDDGGLPLIVSV